MFVSCFFLLFFYVNVIGSSDQQEAAPMFVSPFIFMCRRARLPKKVALPHAKKYATRKKSISGACLADVLVVT